MNRIFKKPRSELVQPTWERWNLDEAFLRSLSKYSKHHPQRTLVRVLAEVSEALEGGKDISEVVPESLFSAKDLVEALSHLIKFGVTIPRAKQTVCEFVDQVASWVEQVSYAFEADDNDHNFTWVTWRTLRRSRDLINEICTWAHFRLTDSSRSQITHRLLFGKEIEDFKVSLSESRMLFKDLSLIHSTGGIGAFSSTIKAALFRQDVILNEIRKIKRQQRSRLIYNPNEAEGQAQLEERRAFLEQRLDGVVVANVTYDKQGKHPCDEGTRVRQLAEIEKWLYTISPGSRNFLWLTGDPGCGKSAITASLVDLCLRHSEHVLLTQFFINRNNKETTDPNSYLPSIARQLADKCPEVEYAMYKSLKQQPNLPLPLFSEQVTNLFVDALAVAAKLDSGRIVAVVIDSLDETDRSSLRIAISLFSHLFEALSRYPNIKVFISSRVEDEIRNPFGRYLKGTSMTRIHLDKAASVNDVALLLRRGLDQIVQKHGLNRDQWPGEERMALLAARASGLFIWAVKALRLLQERIEENGPECVNDALDELTGEALRDNESLYRLILYSMREKPRADDDYEKFRRIIGASLVLKEPLCLDDFSGLLNLYRISGNAPYDIIYFMRQLRAVLVAGTDVIDGRTIPTFHKLFFNFITDTDLFKRMSFDLRFCINLVVAKAQLALFCLERLAGCEKELEVCPPGSLQYAFRFCFSHVEEAIGEAPGLVLRDQSKNIDNLRTLLSTVKQTGSPMSWFSGTSDKLSEFSVLKAAYQKVSNGSCPQRVLNTAPSRVYCLAFSPNGQQLASGLYNGLIVIWNIRTGAEIGRLEGHIGWVQTLAYSPSGDRIASGSGDETIRLWDSQNRRLRSILNGHSGAIMSVAFSPCQPILVSASVDNTLRLWDIKFGKLVASLQHGNSVSGVVFAPTGNQIVSSTLDGLLYVWDGPTGKLQQKLSSFISGVHSLAFSPFGDRLAAMGDCGLCFWSREADCFIFDEILSLKLGRSRNSSHFRVAFSPEGKSVALWHDSVRNPTFLIYDLSSGVKIPFSCAPTINAFALSPNGLSVAFNDDKDICIATTPLRLSLTFTALSPDGDCVLCASSDGTVWLGTPKELPVVSKKLEGKVGSLKHVTFSSNNTFLAAVDDDSFYLWNITTLKPPARGSSKNIAPVTSLSFLTDCRNMISRHEDGNVFTWSVIDGALHSKAVTSSLADMVFDFPLLLDVDEDGKREVAGAQWFPVKKERSSFWAYIDGSLIRVRTDGTISVLPCRLSRQ